MAKHLGLFGLRGKLISYPSCGGYDYEGGEREEGRGNWYYLFLNKNNLYLKQSGPLWRAMGMSSQIPAP